MQFGVKAAFIYCIFLYMSPGITALYTIAYFGYFYLKGGPAEAEKPKQKKQEEEEEENTVEKADSRSASSTLDSPR